MIIYDEFVKWDPKSSKPQMYAVCPLHDDTNASLTVNTDTNQWYCHGCAQGGGPAEFVALYYNVGKKVAQSVVSYWEKHLKLLFPSDAEVERLHQELLVREREIKALHSYGVTDEVITALKIGWDDNRYQFPIMNQWGQTVNIRKYLPPHKRYEGESARKVLNSTGLGEPRFYPIDALAANQEVVYLVEGERDMIVARSQGLNAVTGTGGSAPPVLDIGLFTGKTVYIMTDADFAGDKLAKLYAKVFRDMKIKHYRIALPCKDYADFYKEFPGEAPLDYLKEEAEESGVLADTIDTSAPVAQTLLARSEDIESLNAWMLLEGMSVIGTDPKTYTVPVKLAPFCRDQNCTKTCMAASGGAKMAVDVEPRQIIRFIDSSDQAQAKYLQGVFGCNKMQAEPVDFVNAQKILFQESASFVEGIEDSTFEHRYGVFLYEHDRLSPTQKYNFECCRVADPRSQQNYYVIRSATRVAEAAPTSTSDFLEPFRAAVARCSTFRALLDLYYLSWKPVLNIEGRVDLFGAMLLTYLSVTEIVWRGGRLKGWLDTMVMGDTRTGKSQMAQRMVKALQLGSYINGENARATGVIGGVQRMGDSWVITWGAIPMNDRGLLIIDEASGLEVEDIKDLSATRSSGAVTINKIAKGEARARTRLLWMSNPRSGRNLEEFYWRGYGAFVEFIPIVEDQARFDLVLTAAREDVPKLEGYKDIGEGPDFEVWRALIRFAWTLSSDNIIYSEALAAYIAEQARHLDSEYGGGPLVVGVAVHEKIIRLTCAVAILRGDVSQDNQLVLTTKAVDWAIEFMKMTFDKPSMDYKTFIIEYKKAQKRRGENTEYVRGLVTLHPAIRILLASNMFRGNQVREVLGVDANESSKVISELLQRGLLKITGSGAYAPDKLLVEITKQMEV